MSSVPVHIDLDNLLEVALKGVRRASIFMGLGVNAATDEGFNKYQLSSLTKIQLVPDEVPAETLRHFKDEFRIWIEAGGFRELSETFGRYLDGVHYVCLVMSNIKNPGSFGYIPQADANYRAEGFPNKLNILAQRFAIAPTNADYLVSLSRARNCLTHRQGIVADEDIRGGSELEVKWLGLDVFAEEPNGAQHSLNEIPSGGIHFPNGSTVKAQFVERVRTFSRGQKLVLSTRDLAEICWFYDREARSIIEFVITYAGTLGITVARNEP